jgi:hypothetical protein
VTGKLTLDDIADLRAYERERDEFREHIIDLKKKRRVGIGPVVTVVFENRDTVRFQIQEMARAERMLTDEAIQSELDIYNPLVPEPGQLAMTLFIELTDKDGLMNWLPKLVGIERSLELRLGDGTAVPSTPEAAHAQQLTRVLRPDARAGRRVRVRAGDARRGPPELRRGHAAVGGDPHGAPRRSPWLTMHG